MNRQRFRDFSADPFGYMDKLDLSFHGVNFNFFQKYLFVQKAALAIVAVCGVLWLICGFDSSPLQLIQVVWEWMGSVVSGKAVNLAQVYQLYYGKEMHYSAFVIYVALYYFMSKSWQKAGVVNTRNMVFSFAGMFLSIGLFEWFWISCFGVFQHQPWVYTWQMPQLRILLQNTAFTLVGGLTCLYMLVERYHWAAQLNVGQASPVWIQGERAYYFRMKEWLPWLMVALSVAAALFWIYYPGYVQSLSVQLTDGSVWHNSNLFPQTLYTVKTDPGSLINAGDWFWVENNWIHAVNTIVKVIWAVATFTVLRVRSAHEQR